MKLYQYKFFNIYAVIFIATAFYCFHPQITEHVEFALSHVGRIKYTDNNWFFNFISGEISSQITLASILLEFNLNKYFIQLLLSWIFTIFPFIAIWIIVSKISSNDWNFYIIVIIIISTANIPNWYFYPYAFQIGFFSFGNIGFWLFVIFFGLLINNKSSAYLISGILLSFHIPWGIASLLLLALNNFYIVKKINQKNLFLFGTGSLVSILLVAASIYYKSQIGNNYETISHSSGLLSIFSSSKNWVGQFYAYDPFIWNNSHNPYIFYSGVKEALIIIFNLFLPTIFLNLKLNDSQLDDFRKKILPYTNFIGLIVFLSLTYLEVARYVEMPFVGLVNRFIPNRYLCLSNLMCIIIIIRYLLECFFDNKYDWKFFILLFIFAYLLNIELNYLYAVFFIIYYSIYRLRPTVLHFILSKLLLKLLLISFLYITIFFLPHSKYTTLTYLNSTDSVFNYLDNLKEGDILISPNIQSNNGMNVALFSGFSFHVLSKLPFLNNGKLEEVFCYKENIDYIKLVSNVDQCFSNRHRNVWMQLGRQLGIRYVIVLNSVKLDLELVSQNNLFSIYEIPK
jgi:hypothetical protein